MLARVAKAVTIAFVVWVFFGLALLAVILINPPGEAPDDRTVAFTVEVAMPDGPRARTDRNLVLRLAPADASSLDLAGGTVAGNWVTFVVRTGLSTEGDAAYEFCLSDQAAIVDLDTGATEHRIPAGTCLSERDTLELG